jgi:hypothetical protein
MIGSKRSRRLGALLAGAALVIAVAGCTVGTTSIPAGVNAAVIECRGGPTPGTFWLPGPGTQQVRFQVLSSDAPKPLVGLVAIDSVLGGLGTVWDGTKSTGPQTFSRSDLADVKLGLGLGYQDGSGAAQSSNTTWVFTALDANGKDVGFTCSD